MRRNVSKPAFYETYLILLPEVAWWDDVRKELSTQTNNQKFSLEANNRLFFPFCHLRGSLLNDLCHFPN